MDQPHYIVKQVHADNMEEVINAVINVGSEAYYKVKHIVPVNRLEAHNYLVIFELEE